MGVEDAIMQTALPQSTPIAEEVAHREVEPSGHILGNNNLAQCIS